MPECSLVAQTVKHLPTMWETLVQSLGRENPLEKETVTHSTTTAWKSRMDGGAWEATVHGVSKSRTSLSAGEAGDPVGVGWGSPQLLVWTGCPVLGLWFLAERSVCHVPLHLSLHPAPFVSLCCSLLFLLSSALFPAVSCLFS